MKDKETQRELWKIYSKAKDLDNILAHNRANEAIQLNQAALSNQAVAGVHPKTGQQGEDCKQQTKKTSQPCGFCAGPERCMAKECKARNNKCGKCKLYGHFDNCCTKWIRSKG